MFFTELTGRLSREQMAAVMMSLDSAGGESMQELWKMLEENEGISPGITPQATLEGTSNVFRF